MLLALNILLSLVLALVVTLLVVLILARQPGLRRGVGFYSPLIYALLATVGISSQRAGSEPIGLVATVVMGLIVLLTGLAMRPRGPGLRLLTSEDDSEPGRHV